MKQIDWIIFSRYRIFGNLNDKNVNILNNRGFINMWLM